MKAAVLRAAQAKLPDQRAALTQASHVREALAMIQAKHPDPVAPKRSPAPHVGAAVASVQAKKAAANPGRTPASPPPILTPHMGRPGGMHLVIQRLGVDELWDRYFEIYDMRMKKVVSDSNVHWFNLYKNFETSLYKHKEAATAEAKATLEVKMNESYELLEQANAKVLDASTPTSLEQAVSLAASRIRRRLTSGSTVICEMWDTETARWYSGSSAHGGGQGNVPGLIWNLIPDVDDADRSDWAFGKNCAEVDCVIKAYAAGKTATSLQNCYFIAFHIPLGRYIGPCRTCNQWIPQSRGKAYSPHR